MGGKLGFYNTNAKLLFCPDSSRTCMRLEKFYFRGPVFTKNIDEQEQKAQIPVERICVMTGVFCRWSQGVIGRRDVLDWRYVHIFTAAIKLILTRPWNIARWRLRRGWHFVFSSSDSLQLTLNFSINLLPTRSLLHLSDQSHLEHIHFTKCEVHRGSSARWNV